MTDWLTGWMNEWMNECMHAWMHAWMNELMNECMHACMNECMHAPFVDLIFQECSGTLSFFNVFFGDQLLGDDDDGGDDDDYDSFSSCLCEIDLLPLSRAHFVDLIVQKCSVHLSS